MEKLYLKKIEIRGLCFKSIWAHDIFEKDCKRLGFFLFLLLVMIDAEMLKHWKVIYFLSNNFRNNKIQRDNQ